MEVAETTNVPAFLSASCQLSTTLCDWRIVTVAPATNVCMQYIVAFAAFPEDTTSWLTRS
jgi:hypothetical protein